MTTPKEALELKPCPFCGGKPTWMKFGVVNEYFVCCDNDDCFGPHTTASGEDAAKQWNTRAAASIEGDAVERVARTPPDELDASHNSGEREPSVMPAYSSGGTELRARARLAWNGWPDAAESRRVIADHEARDPVSAAAWDRVISAILATGLVPDEAAIRADWHTTGWDLARNSGRILLVWREFAGVREHVELGRYSDSKVAWVNTYGHPFHAEPDGWAPLLPFRTAESISADEREKCAKIAEAECYATTGRQIAAAIRSNRREA